MAKSAVYNRQVHRPMVIVLHGGVLQQVLRHGPCNSKGWRSAYIDAIQRLIDGSLRVTFRTQFGAARVTFTATIAMASATIPAKRDGMCRRWSLDNLSASQTLLLCAFSFAGMACNARSCSARIFGTATGTSVAGTVGTESDASICRRGSQKPRASTASNAPSGRSTPLLWLIPVHATGRVVHHRRVPEYWSARSATSQTFILHNIRAEAYAAEEAGA